MYSYFCEGSFQITHFLYLEVHFKIHKEGADILCHNHSMIFRYLPTFPSTPFYKINIWIKTSPQIYYPFKTNNTKAWRHVSFQMQRSLMMYVFHLYLWNMRLNWKIFFWNSPSWKCSYVLLSTTLRRAGIRFSKITSYSITIFWISPTRKISFQTSW